MVVAVTRWRLPLVPRETDELKKKKKKQKTKKKKKKKKKSTGR